MKNQDPTKPNDPSQTLSQLASFSNVEQSIKLNEKLDQLVASSTASVAASMVGRLISSLDGTVSGLVTDVESGEAGLVAVLEDGSRLEIAQGYRIRAA
jgi:flagellar basal-body rod modification protein FlgD